MMEDIVRFYNYCMSSSAVREALIPTIIIFVVVFIVTLTTSIKVFNSED